MTHTNNPQSVSTSSGPGKPKVSGHIEGSHRVTTQTESPTGDAHQSASRKTVTTTSTESIAGIPVRQTTNTTVTVTEDVRVNEYTGGKKTQTDTQISGRVDFNNQGNTAPTSAKPVSAKKPASSSAVRSSGSAKDTVRVAFLNSTDKTDFDMGVDAREDAQALNEAVSKLRKTLGDYGILPKAADLQIIGAEQIDALTTVIQNDYMSVREGNIVVNYTDHLGGAFNEKIANIPITHRTLAQVTDAFSLADEAVRKLVTSVSAGQSISQEDISNTVRATLKQELKGIQ